ISIPIRQAVAVSGYLMKQKLKGNKRYPLVLMLEPLYRCNLACAGCGKIQHPEDVLNTYLTPEQCWDAAEECGAPVVSIAGGEPLVHPQIDEIVAGLVQRKKFVYLCTNAILLERWLPKLNPSTYLTISVHMDGMRELHDAMVDREGVFDKAVAGIREAKRRGYRVSTNTTVFADSKPEQIGELFTFLSDELKVDGMMVSPGYDYPKAPNQNVFLKRPEMIETFKKIFALPGRRNWRFFHTPLFLEFLQGKRAMQCTAWGNPTGGVFGCGSGAGAPDRVVAAAEASTAEVVIIAGVCGGLDPSLGPGSLILARRLVAAGEPDLTPSHALLDAARRALLARDIGFVSSTLLTTDRPIASRDDRTAAWNEHGAAGVDMETYGIAKTLDGRGIRWLALRGVVDPATGTLPAPLLEWREEQDERGIVRLMLRTPASWPS